MKKWLLRFRLWLLRPVMDDLAERQTRIIDCIQVNRAVIYDQTEMPRMTTGMLMAWDAISFAVEKYAKDINTVPRQEEILLWTRAYLHENHWPVPVEEELLLLLTLRDKVNDIRLVGKFN